MCYYLSMKKICFTFLFIFCIATLTQTAIAQSYNDCKTLFNDGKYNLASNCFCSRINDNPNDVQSRFWYAAALYFDRKYELSYAQYNYIAQKYPNSNIGKYSKKEAEKVKARIENISYAKSNDTGNYLSDLDRTSKWTSMPIRVWVEPCLHTTTAQKAFKEWQQKTGNLVRFVFVGNKNASQINVEFVSILSQPSADNLGLTTLKYNGRKNLHAKIEILEKTASNRMKTQTQLYAVILHEIGHALGISGHSRNNNDIMYANDFTNDIHLSQRDINTIRAIYK